MCSDWLNSVQSESVFAASLNAATSNEDNAIRDAVVLPMEDVALDEFLPVELEDIDYMRGIELNSFLDPLRGHHDEPQPEGRSDQIARTPSPPLRMQDPAPGAPTQAAPVIDLTSDDLDDDAPVVVATHYPDPTLFTTPKRNMIKKRKLPMEVPKKQRKGPPSTRHVRYDPEHMRSAECTQVCLDNQVALEMYRKATTCAICLDTLRDLTSTSCGHIFCRECIVQALLASQKCPMCQTPTLLHDIHALYL